MKTALNSIVIPRVLMAGCACLALTACGGGHVQNPQMNSSIRQMNVPQGSSDVMALERAFKANPQNQTVAANYAYVLRKEGQTEEAIAVLKPLAGQKEASVDVLNEYASVLLTEGDYKKAEKVARKAVGTDNTNGESYHLLGIALDAQAFHPQAEKAFRRALKLWQGDPVPVMNNLALNLTAQGYLDEAAELLREARKLDPERREIERNLRIVNTLREASVKKPE